MMGIPNLIGGFIVLAFGLIIRILKAGYLIAGYNTASLHEKTKYNEEKLIKFIGNMLIFSSPILIAGGILSEFSGMTLYALSISWVLFLAIIIFSVIYMNTKKRLIRKAELDC